MDQDGRKRKIKPAKLLFYATPVLLSACALIFGTLFLRDYLEYRAAEQEYEALRGYIQIAEQLGRNENSGASEDSGKAEAETVEYPRLLIDYDSLNAANEDFSSVLYIPALALRYPVAASRDNNDYLHRTFEGKRNFAGAIFLDAYADGSYTEPNTFIFGHNMKDGSMFGRLSDLEEKPELLEAEPYVYLYRKGEVRKYRIFSCFHTDYRSDVYRDFHGEEGYDEYIRDSLRQSGMQLPEEELAALRLSERPPLLTLSTCAGRSGGSSRFVVHCALVGVAQE